MQNRLFRRTKAELELQSKKNKSGYVNSIKDFEEFAHNKMKEIHGDGYDKDLTAKVVRDLKVKYKGNPSAMVGALLSGGRGKTKKQSNIFRRMYAVITDTPLPLKEVDPKLAKEVIKSGLKDGDKLDDSFVSKKTAVPVNKLKGAQTEIIPEKAIQMALGMMLSKEPTKIGGDLGSILSKDNYIMDGHHRWAATYLCDPTEKVEGTVIDLPGGELVTALNYITAGVYNRKGNPGKGNIKDFKSSVIGKILDDYIKNGIPGQYPISKDDVKLYLGRVPGANGDPLKGRDLMCKNADKLPKDILPGAPDRIDMPVINPEEVMEVATLIKKGAVDLVDPISDSVEKLLN